MEVDTSTAGENGDLVVATPVPPAHAGDDAAVLSVDSSLPFAVATEGKRTCVNVRDRRFQVVLCITLVLLIGLAVGIGISLSRNDEDDSSLATQSGGGAIVPYPTAGSISPSGRPSASPVVTSLPSAPPSSAPIASPSAMPSGLPSAAPTVFPWVQVGSDMEGSDGEALFGETVSLSSDGLRIAVGAEGAEVVRVFELGEKESDWNELGMPVPWDVSTFGVGKNAVALSADGKRLAVGSPDKTTANGFCNGEARVYEFNSTAWNQLGTAIIGDKNLGFGCESSGTSVALSGDGSILSVGTPWNDHKGEFCGQAQIFDLEDGKWVKRGQSLYGEAAQDQFGYWLSLSSDGDLVSVGSKYGGSTLGSSGAYGCSYNTGPGHVRTFQYNGTKWNQIGQTLIGDDFSARITSSTLSADGRRLAAAALWANLVRIYERDEGSNLWKQIGGDLVGNQTDGQFGFSISLSEDGRRVAVGARWNDGNGNKSGNVRIFEFRHGSWTQVGRDIQGEAASDKSGASVSLSADGHTVAIGAPENDRVDTRSGQVRVFKVSGQ